MFTHLLGGGSTPAPSGPEEHILMVYAEDGDGTVTAWNNGDWEDARDGDGDEAWQEANNQTGAGVTAPTFYVVGRVFYDFDLSFFDGVDRTMSGIDIDISCFGFNESTIMAFGSNFTGTTATSDYHNYLSTEFFDTPQALTIWDGGNYARNPMPLNTAGLAYVATKYSDNVAFCLREYANDVLDVQPTGEGRNGVYHMLIGYSTYQRQPRLILTYQKVPNWVQKFGPSDFSLTTNGTWDGVKYTATNSAVNLEPVGTWFVDERPIKVRVTFTVDATAWIEMKNTEGSGELFDDRNSVTSTQEIYINNYGNHDMDYFWIYLTTGSTITNIEFLYP